MHDSLIKIQKDFKDNIIVVGTLFKRIRLNSLKSQLYFIL